MKELDKNELKEVDGGWIVPVIVGALIGAALTQDLGDLADAFNEGRADAASN